jgi:CRISPR/Cas system CMR-associated protein Cmr5 small subunit
MNKMKEMDKENIEHVNRLSSEVEVLNKISEQIKNEISKKNFKY